MTYPELPASHPSLFIASRVNTLIDKMLEKNGTPEALALRVKVNKTRINCPLMLELKLFTKVCNMTTLCSLAQTSKLGLLEEILWSKVGGVGQERCQETEVVVGIHRCQEPSLNRHS